MASNTCGNLFKITTWGESHGKAIGVVIDGCPAGIPLDESVINKELRWRAPGKSPYTSPRHEEDHAEILSGLFEGKTTGTPISILIPNQDVQSKSYETNRNLLRPGHSNYTYLEKYGVFDPHGGGRASARETACRVAAGAVAKKILSDVGVVVVSYLRSVGLIESNFVLSDVNIHEASVFRSVVRENPLFCPEIESAKKMEELLEKTMREKDSIGGVVEAVAFNLPVGWGDPVYEKLEANLAKAMLSIPASKGFEIGEGFSSAKMKGAEHNDLFTIDGEGVSMTSNHAGGTLGGISNGMPLMIKVPFKPTSTIGKDQQTVNLQGSRATLTLPEGSRHDPCVAIRAVPVVEAMFALVLVDAMLMNRLSR